MDRLGYLNTNSITFNDINYELYHSFYEAEQEMMDRLSVLNIKINGPISESSYIVLQESVKDTIMNFIRKVTSNIQAAWNKFKSKMVEISGNRLVKGNDKYLNSSFTMNPPKDFEIPDLNKLNTFLNKNIESYSDTLNEKLKNVDEFLKAQYSEYYTSDDFVKSVMDKIITKATGEEKIDSAQIKVYVTYLTDTYKKSSDSIAEDLKKINESAKTIERLLGTQNFTTPVDVVNKPEPNQINNGEKEANASFTFSSTLMNYFNEAEEEKKEENSNNKDDNKFKNADPKAEEEKKENDNSKEIVTYVRNYYKAMTKVLSLKMQICSRSYNKVYMIVKKYIDLQKSENKESNKTDKKSDENTNSETSQNNNDNQIDI